MNLRLIFGFAACVVLPGCVVEADDGRDQHPGAGDSTLVLDWTIDGSKDPNQCDQSGSSSIDITVTTDGGAEVGEFQQSCDAFATSIDLPPGHYHASAVLIDGGGHDRTTAVQTGGFDLFGDDELTVPVDFPASSFY